MIYQLRIWKGFAIILTDIHVDRTCSGSSTAGDWLGCLSLAARLAAMGVSGAEEGSEEEAAEPSPMNVDGEAAEGLVSPMDVAPFSRGTCQRNVCLS